VCSNCTCFCCPCSLAFLVKCQYAITTTHHFIFTTVVHYYICMLGSSSCQRTDSHLQSSQYNRCFIGGKSLSKKTNPLFVNMFSFALFGRFLLICMADLSMRIRKKRSQTEPRDQLLRSTHHQTPSILMAHQPPFAFNVFASWATFSFNCSTHNSIFLYTR
jgi:hypothetical protein